jgi:glycosyltransferase involved in cell wall biosynthesis
MSAHAAPAPQPGASPRTIPARLSEPRPLLLHVFPSFGVGGAQVRFANLANRFGERWRHAVVSLDGNRDCAARIAPEVPLQMLPSPTRRGESQVEDLLRIGALLRRLKPGLLVTSNWGSIDWAMARLAAPGLPHLHTEDGFGADESGGQLRHRVLMRRLLLRRSTVVLPSTLLLGAAQRDWRLPAARLRHVPNGLDLRHFNPAGPVALLGPPGPGPLIGTMAPLRPEKNLGRLLRACALLRRQGLALRLVILGDGPERTELQSLARRLSLGTAVRFVGQVADPATAYRALDIFALSSDTEQMPFSVLEAMASALPVASTDVGEIRSMLAAENLPHVSGLKDAALAEALRPLVLDATLRARLGAANRAKAERDYDQEAMFQAYAGLIDARVRKG